MILGLTRSGLQNPFRRLLRNVFLCWLALLSVSVLEGCNREVSEDGDQSSADRPRADRPNLVLISIDTLRPDHLSCYGYERETSPFIDSLAERGLRMENAFAQASWTLPSHMSLFTSTYPQSHQVENEDRQLPPDVPTLTEVLAEQGYQSTGFITWVYLSARFGFGRGFDRYEELLPPDKTQDPTTQWSAGSVVDEVIETWSPPEGEESFFLFLHFFDPHMSYVPPASQARTFGVDDASSDFGRYEHLKTWIRGLRPNVPPPPAAIVDTTIALYDAEIRYTDGELRRLFQHLEAVGALANTLIVLTSDHGEEFGEHGSLEGHQWTLYDEVLRVPLIFVWPDGAAGKTAFAQPAFAQTGVRDELVQTLDIAPTILDVLGLDRPETFSGRSLRALMEDPARWEERTFAQIRRFNAKWSVRTPSHKLIFTADTGTNRFGVPVQSGYEFFDLENDPNERKNLFDETAPVAAELQGRLERWSARRGELRRVDNPNLTPEELEQLRSVGYIGN